MRQSGTQRRASLVPGAVGWLLAVILLLGAADAARAGYDLVVAQDGSGDYTSVQAAILALPARQSGRARIFIKAGTYQERIVIPKSRPRLTLVGESVDTTIITADDYTPVRGTDDSNTATCYVLAKGFGARNLTFANTAGPVGQASYALWIVGTQAHFRGCAIRGYQDTLYLPGAQAFFKRCLIEGAIDFIYGTATTVFKNCLIHCIADGYITAPDMDTPRTYGFVFKSCTVYGSDVQVYLGRALGVYATVAYLNCDLGDAVAPEGWDNFDDPSREDTAFFAEYHNSGPGADTDGRVDWSQQLTAEMAAGYSLDQIFGLTTVGAELTVATPWYGDY